MEDRDVYRIDPPANSDGGTRLVIGLWSLSGDRFSPDLELAYDELFGTRLIVETIRNEPGTYVVQLSEPLQPRPIYVRVDRQQAGTGSDVGNYLLAADYRDTGLSFMPLATGWVDAEFPQQLFTLRVENTQLHLLRLSFLGAVHDSSDVAARVTIYDSGRNPVTSFVGRPGTVVTETVLLPADVYTVRVFGGTRSGSLLPRLDFEISGLIVSDPIGPVPVSPVRRRDWSRQCLAGCYSDRGRYVTWLSSVDPFANPFQ